MSQAPDSMTVGPDVMAAMLHAYRGFGSEQCGVLFGSVAGGVAVVDGCAQMSNVSEDPGSTYQFDPDQQAEVWARVESAGKEVLAIWHTHPHGPGEPSETDVTYMQPWLLYPVVAPTEEGPEVKVYRLADAGGYEGVPLAV